MNLIEDTIAAIVTAPGEAGVAIVRVSGPKAFEIADAIFEGKGRRPSEAGTGTFLHGTVQGIVGDIDEILLMLMRAPHSYTREDVVEFQGHGGPVSARRILRRVIEEGARLAEPGEFTRRAFLNGRLDLAQAEAVLDLIKARSERAASAAVDQLEGGLSRVIEDIYERGISVASDVEATLDFPEEDLPPAVFNDIRARLKEVSTEVSRLIQTWDEGHLLRDGALVVIAGKPNVGKSTLLNLLLGTDRAIVSDIPGTTRDSIEEGLVLDGVPIRLVDTAGLRETVCAVEQEGIARTRRQLEKADIHLLVLDASQPVDSETMKHIEGLDPRRSVLVLNKIDLGEKVTQKDFLQFQCVRTSLLTAGSADAVGDAISRNLEQEFHVEGPPHAVISERHRLLLIETAEHLDAADALLASERDDDIPLAAARMRDALEAMGTITGKTYEEELLDHIFSRFCIGK
ncbi:MAG: tRNA uridine-5-carboxymethylaminomethyl(34) synthesis GTPase MnmE [Verrucomicrobia bacterium]|nr:tRNA uridine-5-carboxymethylaminomethyl(34) synthesis GTPase MnmE [Verrucomicrobiota bacterium]